MRIGLALNVPVRPLPDLLASAEQAASAGFDSVWLSDTGAWDPLTVAALIGARVPGLRVGTAVVQLLGRHPLHLAAQALTTQAATGGLLTLGVGPSHEPVVRQRFGLSFDRPVLQVRERLDALLPALAGEEVDVHGSTVAASGSVTTPGTSAPPVLLSAHGPRMLRLAGARAQGALTLWSRSDYVRTFVAPTLRESSTSAALVVGANMAITDFPAAAHEYVARTFANARALPTYRSTLDRQGMDGLADTSVIGDEAAAEAAVREYADAGVTELIVFTSGPPDERPRTIEALSALARRYRARG